MPLGEGGVARGRAAIGETRWPTAKARADHGREGGGLERCELELNIACVV
jgi:hypothetical protein